MSNCYKHALMIVNPTAGKRTIKSDLFTVMNVLATHGCIATVCVTQARGDASEFVRNRPDVYDVAVCCGGDGTLNEVITGMMDSDKKIPIGYIPCGSTNDTANTLGIPRNVNSAAELLFNGQPSDFDIGSFNGTRYFSYIASFGAFTKVSYATPQSAKNALGHLAYVLEGAKSIGTIKPSRLRLEFDGETIEDDFLFGAVSNSTSAGGVRKYPKNAVDLNDGLFELLLIRNPKNPVMLSNTVIALSTKTFEDPNILLFHAGSFKLKSDKPLEWTIDGEFGGEHSELTIDNIRGAVKIVRPTRRT